MAYYSFKELLKSQSKDRGNNTFIIEPNTKKEITFLEFNDEVERISDFLNKLNINNQDKVALFMENGIEYAESFFGATYDNKIAVPVNLSYKENELKYLLDDADIRFLITTKSIYERTQNILKNTFSFTTREIGIRDLLVLEREEYRGEKVENQELALILYTSGTTGNPKGVMLTQQNLLSEAEHIIEAHKLTDKDTVLCSLPLFHINGLVVTLITPLTTGMRLIMPPKFSASNFWKNIDKYKVTWISAVPTIYSILLSKEFDKTLDYSSLRFARSASAPLPIAVLKEFESRYNIPIIETFGISEGGSQIASNPLPPQKTKVGSVGLGFGNEIKIINDNSEFLPAREEGEIIVRGDNIAQGYLNKEKETKSSFLDGWFHTGDLGYLDEEGYLFISGRKKELINRAGEKFSPREIDEVLYQIPQIELAAAVGVPDPMYNEEVVAYVKLRDNENLTEDYIIKYCKDRLANFKVPKRVFFTDDFPKGPSGKIQRLKFIERYKKENL